MTTLTLPPSPTPPSWAADITDDYLLSVLQPPPPEGHTIAFLWKPRQLEQSNVAIVEVTDETLGGAVTHRLFFKRTNVRWLQARMSKTAEKWVVTVRSFMNELNFYRHANSLAMCDFGASIPRVYAASIQEEYPSSVPGEDRWFDRQFTTLLQCLPAEEYEEFKAYDLGQTLAALAHIARFHAYFWRIPSLPSSSHNTLGASPSEWESLASSLFQPGCWWRLHLRPSVKFETFPSVFTDLCRNLPECAPLATEENDALARWIADHLAEISAATVGGERWRTLAHGDLKTSNTFFKRGSDQTSTTLPELVAIDLQWSGPARSGMGDLAYLLAGGVLPQVLHASASDVTAHPWYKGGVCSEDMVARAAALGVKGDGIAALLVHYHACLRDALASRIASAGGEKGRSAEERADAVYPLDAVFQDFALDLVDYVKTAVPYILYDLTPAICEANYANYGWLSHEYDPRCTAWILDTCFAATRVLKQRLERGESFGWESEEERK